MPETAGAHLHFDCPSGLAGDMFLGACLDLGLPLEALEDVVKTLDLEDVSLRCEEGRRGALRGKRFEVLVGDRVATDEHHSHAETPVRESARHVQSHDTPPPGHSHGSGEGTVGSTSQNHGRTPAEIRALIEGSSLEASIRDRALGFFSRLAEAEARVHGVPLEAVHFHEVGAVDAIVDLVGAAVAWEYFRPARVSCGRVNVGGGVVSTAHGELPVPAPATTELLSGVPIYGRGTTELLTPTGAVILAEMVDEFGDLPPMEISGAGYGLGARETEGRANVFRLFLGTATSDVGDVILVETQVDDVPGEALGYLVERLHESDVLDAWLTPVQMKKNRPGTLVSALCREADLDATAALLLTESGSLGCRYTSVSRFEAERDRVEVRTPYGVVRVKRGRFAGRTVSSSPEYEDCRRLAVQHAVPWRVVYQAALAALPVE